MAKPMTWSLIPSPRPEFGSQPFNVATVCCVSPLNVAWIAPLAGRESPSLSSTPCTALPLEKVLNSATAPNPTAATTRLRLKPRMNRRADPRFPRDRPGGSGEVNWSRATGRCRRRLDVYEGRELGQQLVVGQRLLPNVGNADDLGSLQSLRGRSGHLAQV